MSKDNTVEEGTSHKKTEKMFIFGIDGGTFSLIRPWVEEGALPAIGKIMEEGTCAISHSTIPPVSCPAWKSFATGMNPGKLGVFDLVCREPETYTIQPPRADMIAAPDVWDVLSEAGYRVGVFNVPVTYPPHPVKGFIVPGMLGDAQAPDFTYPPELKEEIEKMLGHSYVIEAEEETSDLDQWLKQEYAVTEQKVKIAQYLLKKKKWDFFISVFYEVDRVQHIFWHYMDKAHPRYTPSQYEDTIKHSYQRMDTFLQQFLNLLPTDTTVIVMSDHGFGPVKGSFRLSQWLLSKSYVTLNEESMKSFFESMASRFLKSKSSPDAQNVSQNRPSPGSIGGVYQIDWSQTKAYTPRIGNVYLNVQGREPEGIIEMGKEYDTVRNQLIEDLSTLSHSQKKTPMKVTVLKKEEVYWGPYFNDAPDLLISIEGYFVEPGFGPLWVGLKGESGYATGGHQKEGIFMATGTHIIPDQWMNPISIMDIAPTILHIMDSVIPGDMDGCVLHELFRQESLLREKEDKISDKRPLSTSSVPSRKCNSETDSKVLKRLQDLGYLE